MKIASKQEGKRAREKVAGWKTRRLVLESRDKQVNKKGVKTEEPRRCQ